MDLPQDAVVIIKNFYLFIGTTTRCFYFYLLQLSKLDNLTTSCKLNVKYRFQLLGLGHPAKKRT